MEKIPRIEVPDNREKIEKQINALRYAISQDINSKDKQIHLQALKDLEAALAKAQNE